MSFPITQTRKCFCRIPAGRILRPFCGILFLLSGSVAASSAAETGQSTEALAEIPLERLLEVSVISASRKSQTLSDVSSAVFVINQDDIRRSGATTIPDLLRMVPGVQVASVDGKSWAVSIRGFNGTFANKLLVMVDGRTVYTPLYGGVYWDVQDTPLDSIERIEVIRGSGGTMWGANAVNGVINIITKNTHDTKGGQLTGLIGSRERGTVSAQYGSEIGDSTSYRLYVKHADRGDTHATTGTAADSLQITRGGFRIDSNPVDSLHLTMQGDMYSGTGHTTTTTATFIPPFTNNTTQASDLFGADILSRLDWIQSESSKFSLQFYYDRTGRDESFIKEDRDTVDIDLQHNVRLVKNHEITWGAGYRFVHDHSDGTEGIFLLNPNSRSENLVNLFAQDEITLLPDTLRLVIGTKLEHNDFTGWELQPSARVLWTPYKGYSVWTAVTRSVRTPSRADQDSRITVAAVPPTPPFSPLPSVVVLLGNRELKSESLLAYELGFRADLSDTLSLDISSFYNQYHDIIDTKPGTPFNEGGTLNVIPYNSANMHSYDSCGGEISLQWQPREWWKIKGGYAYIRFYGDSVEDSQAAKGTPLHQATLRSMLALGRNVDLDLWARYVDANRYSVFNSMVLIPAYVTLDARLAWRPMAGVELSLVGQNLLEKRHPEAVSDITSVKHEIERTVYGKVSWAF
ncbi:MAG: TonB-dependent receptor [Geobacteraceae bacterium]|nr:TonB-dependent receptor [Geobacteraceae bacterium]NTW80865.1 TonB-dependent receptor [Geobacteraceae bacterium]